MKPMNRRSFLGTSTQTIAGFSLAAATWPTDWAKGQVSSPNPTDTLVLALAGAGGRGSELVRNFAGVPNVEFKYLCEANDNRGAEVQRALTDSQRHAPQRLKDSLFRRP
jgi:hypothetical protein